MSNVAFGSRKKTFWSSLEQAPSGKFRDSSPPSKAPRHRPVSGAPSPGPLRAPPHSRPCSNPPHPEHSYLLSRAPLAVARGRRIMTQHIYVDSKRIPSRPSQGAVPFSPPLPIPPPRLSTLAQRRTVTHEKSTVRTTRYQGQVLHV